MSLKKIIPGVFLFSFIISLNAQNRPDALKLFEEKRFEEAVRACRDELAEMPRNMDSYTVLGWSLLALGRNSEALAEAQKALQIAPNDYRIIKIAAEALFNLGRYSEALAYFQKYVAILPGATNADMASVYYFIGEIYIRLGEYENADIALSTAVYFKADRSYWWYRLGYAREMKKDYTYALEAYEKALQLNPQLEEAQKGAESVKKKMAS